MILVMAAGFSAGWFAHRFHYDDICLDMGGGRNPGGHPICVIDAQAG